MKIIVNGDERACDEGATIGSFLEGRNLPSKMVVVEYNGEILRRELYGETSLSEGDVLEIVQMMAGG
ncbi:sulfur carrier protein ThiS [Capsulimonas corticalis]|uniref:Sulfur carrier protein ThiS n=1 Tax=Capsulimonas corticalis TaxID=2219043 RepID=A0A402D3M7_9BACT|nr:sulfur carrier protein ThiS [Capsulimonas corticalis]BDI31873.1 sulfur carrier protein ThiS [Capsulimonas corticalis]